MVDSPPPQQPEQSEPLELDLNTEYYPRWDRTTRLVVMIFLILAGLFALTLLAHVIQMLMIAFIIAFVIYSPVRMLYRHTPLPWAGSVAIVYVFLIIIVIYLIVSFIPSLVDGVNSVLDTAEQAYADLQITLTDYEPEQGLIEIPLAGTVDLNPIVEQLQNFVLGPDDGEIEESIPGLPESVNLQEIVEGIFNVAGSVTGTVTSAITGFTGLISTVLLAVFVSLLLLLEVPDSDDFMEIWIPHEYHREMYLLIQQVTHVWNGFFRGQVLIGFIIGLLTWLQLVIMGIPFAEVLAVITGIISLIPTIGGIFALFPLSLIPLFQGSTSPLLMDLPNFLVALLVIGINLVISQVIWNVVAPKILGDAVALPLPVIIIGVFIGAAAGGILGAFLVAPIMGTLRVLVVYLLRKLGERDPFPDAHGQGVPDPYHRKA